MTIAIHQPNYLPWLGYFYKIANCDCFVFLDDVQYIRQSFTRRVCIRQSPNELQKSYLIVPLQKHSRFTNINDLHINHEQGWQKRQLGQVHHAYQKSENFDRMFSLFQTWMEASYSFSKLSEFNIYLIKEVCQLLKIDCEFVRSSDLSVMGSKQEYIINIVKHLNGEVYLSGKGARKYQEEADFRKANISLQYSTYKEIPDYQAQGEWLKGLSVIDHMMNLSTQEVQNLLI
jgi:hypothetical protein